jgi:phage shock protein PspC (stress-responsive transcriptional regulator)
MSGNKRLYKSDDSVIAGVCGGIAEYFELDPTLIRILTVIVVLIGFGLPAIAYLIAMLAMPWRGNDYSGYIDVKPDTAATNTAAAAAAAAAAAKLGGEAGGGASGEAGAAGGAGAGTGAGTGGAAGVAGGTSSATADTAAFGAVAGTTAAAGATGAASAAAAASGFGKAPGCAYTASNPQAYDTVAPSTPPSPKSRSRYRLPAGAMVGILLVGIGLLALLDTFLDVSAWSFWPVIIIVIGFVMLCTPRRGGWSLTRAGHAICVITLGIVLQLWTLHIVTTSDFILTFLYLWPVLLMVLGLSIIGGATNRSIFSLFASLLLSATLLFGVWNLSEVDHSLFTLPSFTLPTDHLPSGGFFPFN